MPDPATYRILADAVLALHVAFVAFVVAGLLLIVAGNLLAWRWVNAWWFRVLHLAAIVTVAAESWVGIVCPLTSFETWLRAHAHEAVYGGSFIEYWLQRILYYDAPAWMFTVAYTLFGTVVAATWWRFPPQRRRRRCSRSG
jgi:hypothetical protein